MTLSAHLGCGPCDPNVSTLHTPEHPAVLRLITQVIEGMNNEVSKSVSVERWWLSEVCALIAWLRSGIFL